LCLFRPSTLQVEGERRMVNEASWKGQSIYECELCGYGYTDLETAEECEQYCYSHGSNSPKITRKAARKPPAPNDPIVA